jgi:hypothetical protein
MQSRHKLTHYPSIDVAVVAPCFSQIKTEYIKSQFRMLGRGLALQLMQITTKTYRLLVDKGRGPNMRKIQDTWSHRGDVNGNGLRAVCRLPLGSGKSRKLTCCSSVKVVVARHPTVTCTKYKKKMVRQCTPQLVQIMITTYALFEGCRSTASNHAQNTRRK